MLKHLKTLIEDMAINPNRRVGELKLLDVSERDTILRVWNDTKRVGHDGKAATLPELVSAQVKRTPDAIAVVFEGRELSYAALEDRANQLAHRLQKLGVAPDVLVGVCAKRSLELVVSLLAVLKAGGAYVPLDPEAPVERLTDMIVDAGLGVVLMQDTLAPVIQLPSWVSCILVDYDLKAKPERTVENTAGKSDPSLTHLQPQHLAYTDLHLGFDGSTQGRSEYARRSTQPVVLDAGGLWAHRR